MNRKTILVCDDEPHIVRVVAAKLRSAGYEVLTAEDGAEALELAESLRPDLVISDYQMPRMSGRELSVRLRANPATESIPVILLTARGFCIEHSALSTTNVVEIKPKPFSPREILATVERLLGTSADAGPALTAATGTR
jgi:two-component system alkaline phosphatase synthesis response regulator PhoP